MILLNPRTFMYCTVIGHFCSIVQLSKYLSLVLQLRPADKGLWRRRDVLCCLLPFTSMHFHTHLSLASTAENIHSNKPFKQVLSQLGSQKDRGRPHMGHSYKDVFNPTKGKKKGKGTKIQKMLSSLIGLFPAFPSLKKVCYQSQVAST